MLHQSFNVDRKGGGERHERVDAGAVDILPALLEPFCHILVISHALKNGLANLYFPPNW